MGFCLVVVGVGDSGIGKIKAGYIVLVTVGVYLNMFFNMFTDAYNREVVV